MEKQLELFEIETGLVGEEAWVVTKQYCLGKLTKEEAIYKVASKEQLEDDIDYFNSICHY